MGRGRYIFVSEEKKHRRGQAVRRILLLLLPALLIAGTVMNFMVSRHVTLEHLRLRILNMPADLEGYSILHISDLHGENYGEKQKAAAAALGETRYSCVVMTGDMLGENGEIQPLLDLIALMPKETPKYYIPGDTDGSFTDAGAHGSLSVFRDWALELEAAGVTLLDRPVMESRGKGRIWFVPEELYALDTEGMLTVYERQMSDLRERAASLTADDAARLRYLEYEMERLEALQEMKKEVLQTDIQIVLTHVPLTEEYVSDIVKWGEKEEAFSLRYAGLILAGHYNGGQWRLPWGGAVYVPELGWLPEDTLVTGLDYVGGIPQHISPGLGSDPHYTWQPGRLFNPPKLTRIVLSGT